MYKAGILPHLNLQHLVVNPNREIVLSLGKVGGNSNIGKAVGETVINSSKRDHRRKGEKEMTLSQVRQGCV